MVRSFGIAVTNLTSKFGILSRKASMRLATECGKKLADKGAELKRNLDLDEIQEVFTEILPKKCCPEVLTKVGEIIPCFERSGYTKEQIQEMLNNIHASAACVPNGIKKRPIFVPLDVLPQQYEAAVISHELEHALETNGRISCRLLEIKDFISIKGREYIDKIFGTQYVQKFSSQNKRNTIETARLQGTLQVNNGTFVPGTVETYSLENILLNIEPNADGIAKLNGLKDVDGLREKIKSIINKTYISSENYSSNSQKRFKSMKRIFDLEIPAYITGSEVEKYVLGLADNQTVKSKGTAIIYEEAKSVLRKERLAYFKNRILGRLGKPILYHSDKDLFKLANSKEEKKVLKDLITGLNDKSKAELFNVIKENPKAISNIKSFMDSAPAEVRNMYMEHMQFVAFINPEVLKNQDFMKIASITENGYPAYGHLLEELSNATPDKIKEFASLAPIKYPNSGYCVYESLLRVINHENYDIMKQIATIDVNGVFPYADIVVDFGRKLDRNGLKDFLSRIKEAQKEGRIITQELWDELHPSKNTADFKVKPLDNIVKSNLGKIMG